ncbi:hypothetical protein WP12_03935 [Sphingomonas sp. SRS2]|nr:hypothetical protein WP12_03935 [Sphingomonas sp. SRS2]
MEIQAFTKAGGVMKAGKGTWATIDTVWASVKDVLPSRAEKTGDTIDIAKRPARVRMDYREDITSAHRFKLGARIMEIVAGPAEIGHREGMEFMVVEYTTKGEAP